MYTRLKTQAPDRGGTARTDTARAHSQRRRRLYGYPAAGMNFTSSKTTGMKTFAISGADIQTRLAGSHCGGPVGRLPSAD
jgi:hypothetical protein